MIKAFLSHSSAQKKFIEKVAETLGRDNCFVDEYTFENGMKTMDEIVKSIANSALFVFFISKESLDSDWVKDELSNVRDYVDEGKIQFLPFIIDDSIEYDNSKIKSWIRKEYNLQHYKNPILVARKIKEEIRGILWKQHPDICNKEQLFYGREEEMGQLMKKYYDGNISLRRCLIVSGFPSGVGRKKIISEYIKKEIAPNKEKDYEPIGIELSNDNSIEDLIFQLNDIVLEYPTEQLLNLNTESKENKLEVAVNLIKEIDKIKEPFIIRDNGSCVLSNGHLSAWFKDIIQHKNLPHNICLFVTARNNLSNLSELYNESVISLRISPLRRDEIKVLFYAYAKLKNISITTEMDKAISQIPGLPSLIYRAVDIFKTVPDSNKMVAQLQELIITEENSFTPILGKIKEDEETFQTLILLSLFEFVSYDIIEQILNKAGVQNVFKPLEKIYSFALFEHIGGNNQYIRVNSIVADYISRNKILLSPKYKIAMETILKSNISNLKSTYDLSEYLIGIQQAIRHNISKVNKKFLIPSFTLKVVIEEYQSGNYDKVILLCNRFIKDSINFYEEIVRSVRYWLCMALCRLKNQDVFKEIDYFDDYSKYFLIGFYNRCLHQDIKALEYYNKALDKVKSYSDKKFVAKAKHELVVVKLRMKDYEGALADAEENYIKQNKNKYHIEAYFRCLVRTGSQDEELLLSLLDEYKSLSLDKRNEVIYDTLKIEYDFYIHKNRNVITRLRDTIHTAPKNIRYYPYLVLQDIARKMNAEKSINDLPSIYGDDLRSIPEEAD